MSRGARKVIRMLHDGKKRTLVMITTGNYSNLFVRCLVHKSMLAIDSPRPTTGKFVFERLRFTNPREWIALYFLN